MCVCVYVYSKNMCIRICDFPVLQARVNITHANDMQMRRRKLHIWLFWEEPAASHDQTHVTDVLGVFSSESDLRSVSDR